MDPVKKEELHVAPEAELVVYAEHQPEYIPLPVVRFPDGCIFSEWEPTPEEMEKLLTGGKVRVRLWQWTFNQPLQPVRLELV